METMVIEKHIVGDEAQKSENRFTIGLIGDSRVGKSALLERYINNNFSNSSLPTHPKGIKCKSENIGDTQLNLQFLESPFDAVEQLTIHGFILVCDLTDDQSFNNVKRKWTGYAQRINAEAPIVIIANKADFTRRMLEMIDVIRFGQQNNYPVFEASASTGAKVAEAFQCLVKAIAEKPHLPIQRNYHQDQVALLDSIINSDIFKSHVRIGYTPKNILSMRAILSKPISSTEKMSQIILVAKNAYSKPAIQHFSRLFRGRSDFTNDFYKIVSEMKATDNPKSLQSKLINYLPASASPSPG